jgi:hypothetical protein
MPLTNAEVDLAIPVAGTPDRTLTNAALKELIVDVAAKADTAHAHAIADVTGLQAALDGKQPLDTDLTAIAALVSAADKLPYATGAGTWALADFSAFGRSLVDDADATAARATLGLVIGTNVQAFNTGLGQIAGLADPNADRLLFWDDSAGAYTYLTLGTNLSITGTTLNATGGGASALDDLTDVIITAPSTGQVLKFNGTNWVNDTDSTAGGSTALDDLSDVAITSAAVGHLLRHNGTSFVNVLGTDHFQAADAGLLSIAGLTTAADRGIYTTALDTYAVYTLTAGGRALAGAAGTADTFPYFSASNTVSLQAITAAGRALLDDADAAAQLATLGGTAALGTGGLVRGTNATLTTPTFAGVLTMGSGAQVTTANAMSGQAINVANALNTETNAVDRTFTFTGTPASGQVFTALLTNSDSVPHLYTLPTCIDIATGTSAAHVVPVAGGGKAFLAFRYNGSAYELLNKSGFLNKFDATAAPGVTNDLDEGYGAGSLWLDATNNNAYICESAANGAAVWHQLNTGGGSGNVTKVGTPANNQVGVWTGDGTIEGDADLTFDTATNAFAIGASGSLLFGAVSILSDSAGTTTLQNIDALDATTEATIEAAIDTLANLTSIQGHAVTLTGAFSRSGAHALTLTTTGITNVTLPTSGTLAALATDANFNTLTVNTNLVPDANDGAGLGTATLSFADLFLATGGVLNFANGNWVATHSSGILTVGTGDLRVTTAGTNAASVVTVGGTQTLTGKTLTSPTVNGGALAALTALAILNAGTGAFDMTIAHNGTLTAGRTLTWNLNDAARTISLAGNLTLAAAFTTSGANALTLTTTGSTNVTLPTSGTLATQTEAKTEVFCVAVGDETTALTTGTAKVSFRMPYAGTLNGLRASVNTAPTGAALIVDVNEAGSTLMTTNKLSIDATELTSTTAATAATLTDTALADDALITIDIDQVGSTVAGAGLKVWFYITRA